MAIPADGVLLHIGVHKTGTTAMQAALADAREDLVAAGVLYPGSRPAHHRAALSSMNHGWGWQDRGGEQVGPQAFKDLAHEVKSHRGRVCISSEFFCEADEATARTIVESLGGSRVHVVVTLRNLGRLLPSSWQQYLKYGMTTGYEKWLGDVFAAPEDSQHMTPSFWKRHDHGAVVERWAAAVGADHVTVLVLENVERDFPFRQFAELLDIDPEILVSRMSLTSNRSMTAAEAEFLLRLNRRIVNDLTWGQYRSLVREGLARTLVEGRAPDQREPGLSTPDWALDAAAAKGSAAVAVIRACGVPVRGDLDALATRVPTMPAVPEQTDVPIEAAVQALVGVLMAQSADDNAGLVGRVRKAAGRRVRGVLR